MRRVTLLGVILTVVGSLLLAAPEEKGKAETPAHKGFVVHEWGVLARPQRRRVGQRRPSANLGRAAEIRLRPGIVARAAEALAEHRADGQAHSLLPFAGRVRGGFARRLPQRHSRRVVAGHDQPRRPQRHHRQRAGEQALQVAGLASARQETAGPARVNQPAYQDVPDGHWVRTLRGVKADDVYATVGERNFGLEMEHFVYYDGLLAHGKMATITVAEKSVALTNQAKFPLFDVTVVDRRVPNEPRLARLSKLDAGAVQQLDLQDLQGAKWPADGIKTLVGQLKDAGLFEDEAASLVTLWTRDLFESDGVTLFYRLPQEEYERLLPLTLTPRPESLVRVGLVQHPYCEPGLAERVAALVKGLDSDDFDKREAAQKELETMGRAAYVHLLKLRGSITAPEPKRRVELLLEKLDSQRAIQK